MKPWLAGSDPSERFPLWTRANIGEVFPDPVAPLTFTLFMKDEVEGGWRDALVRMGAFTHDEFAPGKMETVGVFGGYAYINASVTRILGERGPGLSAQTMDDLFFGAQPGIPPYEVAPGDVNEERTAAIGEVFQWVLTTDSIDFAIEGEKLANKRRAERPDLDSMSNQALWAYAKDLYKTDLRALFSDHIFVTFIGPVPVAALTEICTAVGRPEAVMGIISGVGDVESAAPSMVMWRLGRRVAADNALMGAFDGGTTGLLERIAELGEPGRKFLSDFEQFTYDYGSRGPNEWEPRYHTWETKPELALAAIDRMRLAGTAADPAAGNKKMAAERERLVDEISAMLADDSEKLATFLAAAKSARLFQAGRERTKTNNVKVIQEARMALHKIGKRMLEKGFCSDVGDFALVFADEFEAWLKDPASFTDTLRERGAFFDQYASLQEPFVFWQTQTDPETWTRRDAVEVEPVAIGDVLSGFPGCPGTAIGTARVILDPIDPTALEPGDILVAPITDPSWTPLFVAAGGVIVDVGAAQSHAMIVSRELGIACVPSVTNATRRIPDGATVEVNGDAGTVTILALP